MELGATLSACAPCGVEGLRATSTFWGNVISADEQIRIRMADIAGPMTSWWVAISTPDGAKGRGSLLNSYQEAGQCLKDNPCIIQYLGSQLSDSWMTKFSWMVGVYGVNVIFKKGKKKGSERVVQFTLNKPRSTEYRSKRPLTLSWTRVL